MTTLRPEDLYPIRDDLSWVPESGPDNRGVARTLDLTRNAIGHPNIRYRDRISTADVYEMDGELLVHFYCPRCAGALKVTNKQKELRFERTADGGRISIGHFACTWDGCGLRAKVVDNAMLDDGP